MPVKAGWLHILFFYVPVTLQSIGDKNILAIVMLYSQFWYMPMFAKFLITTINFALLPLVLMTDKKSSIEMVVSIITKNK